jgi:prepilin-type processing-associated H-X9-DG protein
MSNWLFADGHVKALKPLATIRPLNMWVTTGQDTTAPDPAANKLGGALGTAQGAMQ